MPDATDSRVQTHGNPLMVKTYFLITAHWKPTLRESKAALSAPEGRAYILPRQRLLRKAHLPFRGPWPRASPRVTKPYCGPTYTVNS